jgi:hypothetical protein
MGRRILELMAFYQIKNHAQFAEGVLGVSRQLFHAWLYNPMNPDKIGAKPVLLCAEALGTNAEYLLCISDDPRPETSLSIEEAQMVQAMRDLADPAEIDKLLTIAADWVSRSGKAKTAADPFRVRPPRLIPTKPQ